MSEIEFRAWNGLEILYDLAVTSNGTALRRDDSIRIAGRVAYIAEPNWIVSRWTGFRDRIGNKIFEDDVVELGASDEEKTVAVVLLTGGRFCVVAMNSITEATPRALATYCSPTFNHMIEVVGSIYDVECRMQVKSLVAKNLPATARDDPLGIDWEDTFIRRVGLTHNEVPED